MTRLLRLAALTIAIPAALVALPASAVALVAWGIACPRPRRELYGSGRVWLRAKIREFTRA